MTLDHLKQKLLDDQERELNVSMKKSKSKDLDLLNKLKKLTDRRKQGSWGTESEIITFAKLTAKNVLVYQFISKHNVHKIVPIVFNLNLKHKEPDPELMDIKCDVRLFYMDCTHYDALVSRTNKQQLTIVD